MTSNRHQSACVRWTSLLALIPQIALGDVSVSGRVEQSFVDTESSSATGNERLLKTGNERLLKMGVWSALAYNQDEIDTTLSGMSNKAVREPIGSVGMSYGKVDGLTPSDYYTDSIGGSLTIPVGENFGLNVGGSRTQWQTKHFPGASDETQFYLFNGNPKEGSFGIGFSRSRSMADGFSDTSANDALIGYDWRDAETGSVRASYRKHLGNSDGIDGHHKSISGKVYLDNLILSLGEGWTDMQYDDHLIEASRTSTKDVKYEGEKFTLFVSKQTTDLEFSVGSTMQGIYRDNYNYSTAGATYYPSDNLAFTMTRHGMDSSYNSYKLSYQPPSAKYLLSAQATDGDGLLRYFSYPATFNLSLTLNLGRKQTLKAADRDRDPF